MGGGGNGPTGTPVTSRGLIQLLEPPGGMAQVGSIRPCLVGGQSIRRNI